MDSNKCKDYPIECIYCDPKLEVYLTSTKKTMFKHCRIAHNVKKKTAKKYYRESTTNINDLPDVNLVQIFEEFPWEERLKLEQVCKKWQYVGKNLSWSNERIFDNTPYKNWPESKFMQIEAFFDRCGHHLRHLVFHNWSPVIILSLLGMAPNVQHLKFRDVRLNHEWYGMRKLSYTTPHLKSLCFKNSLPGQDCLWIPGQMTDYGMAECFKMMSSLEYLRISDRGHLLIQHSFVQFPPNLKFISLHRVKNINQILEWIAIGCKDLKALSVSPDYINENGLKAISRMKRLTYLEMNGYASQDASEDIFEALTELRALEIETVNGKLIAAIAQHCKNLEHLQIEVFEAKHANISCLATLPNLCSLEILGECCLEQTIKLINRLIANDKLQYITSNITVPLEILFEMLRRCKQIRSIALDFGYIDYSKLYAKACQVVDEIDESERQQRELTGEVHPIVEILDMIYQSPDI